MTVNPGSNYEGVNVRDPACESVCVRLCVCVISSEQRETVVVGM